jgi:hypothetical protein
MIILAYVGNHANDSLFARLGWAITRLVQRGRFKRVTHVEGYYGEYDGRALIASASLRDGGVRLKYARLDRENWIAVEVPDWDAGPSLKFILDHTGEKYDLRGALATVLLFGQSQTRWFCNEILGASVGLESPEIFGPAQFMALALSMPGAKLVPVP